MSTAATLSTTLPGQSGGPIHLLLAAYRHVLARVERARVVEHLSGLDDRLLADMGLGRSDLGTLYR